MRWEEFRVMALYLTIQSFKQKENSYDVAAYKRICAKFGVNPSTDFR